MSELINVKRARHRGQDATIPAWVDDEGPYDEGPFLVLPSEAIDEECDDDDSSSSDDFPLPPMNVRAAHKRS